MITGTLFPLGGAQLGRLHGHVIGLLENVGLRIDNEILLDLVAKKGARVDKSARVAKFPARTVEETIQWQKNHHRPATPDLSQPPRSGIGGTQLFYYDDDKGERRPATHQDLIDMIHLGDALDEIGSVGAPMIDSEANPLTEPIETLALLAKNSVKVSGFEVIYPHHVKYMAEIGGIITGKDYDGSFIANCNFIISPFILESRSSGCIIEKTRFNIPCVIGSQPVSGMSAPVTTAGVVVQACAEILGGWVIGKSVNDEIPLGGIICSGSLDMKTTKVSFSSPEAILQDLGVIQMFDTLYGGGVESATNYVSAKLPGFQAAWEKLYKRFTLGLATGRPNIYGAGTVDAGAVFSPTQAMIDLELNAALWNYSKGIQIDAEHLAIDSIVEQGIGGNHLQTDHTLAYFREHWMPQLMDRTSWNELDQGSRAEDGIIERAKDKWKTALENHVPRNNMDDAQIKEIDEVVARAKVGLLD